MQVAFPHVDPLVGRAMLAIAGILLVLAFLVWASGWRQSGTEVGASQVTSGPNSPNLSGTFNAPVIIAPPNPAEKQPLNSPYGTSRRPPMDIHPHALIQSRGMSTPNADMPFAGVLVRVYRKLGGAPEQQAQKRDFYDRVDRELSKGVRQNRMSVWGFYGKRGPELLSMSTLANGWFEHKDGAFVVPGDSVHPMRFQHLEFNREQVDNVWPDDGQGQPGDGGIMV